MNILRRSILKGFLVGGVAAATAPGFSRAFAAAAEQPHAVAGTQVVALVAGSPTDEAFLEQARRLMPEVKVIRVDGTPLQRLETFRQVAGRDRRLLALLPDADAVLFREAIRHAGGNLLADERAASGLVSFVAHV